MSELVGSSAGTGTGTAALDESIRALLDIRAGLAKVIEELPDIRRAADVERALGLDRPLAWRIFRSATASDPAAVLQHLPTHRQLLRVVGIARRHGVSAATASAIRDALVRFDEQVAVVAGDRMAYGGLLSGHVRQGLAPIEQRVRRNAFRANAHLWGEQCRTLVFLVALRPGTDGESMDALTVRGWVDMHASRPRTPRVLFSRFSLTRHQTDNADPDRTRKELRRLEVLEGFGTPRDLDLTTVDCDEGKQETHIRLPGVGRESRVSFFMRQQIDSAMPVHRPAKIQHLICTPAEALHFDLLVPDGWSEPSRTTVTAFARPHDVHLAKEARTVDRIPTYDEPTFLPGLQEVPHSPDVPGWPNLVATVMAQRGWAGQRFDLHRLRVAYPMLHASMELEAAPRQS